MSPSCCGFHCKNNASWAFGVSISGRSAAVGCTETPKVFLSTSVLLCVLQGAAAVGNRELAGSPNWFSCFLWQCQSIAVESMGKLQQKENCGVPQTWIRAVTHFPLTLLAVRWISATPWLCWASIYPIWMEKADLCMGLITKSLLALQNPDPSSHRQEAEGFQLAKIDWKQRESITTA